MEVCLQKVPHKSIYFKRIASSLDRVFSRSNWQQNRIRNFYIIWNTFFKKM